MLFTLLSFFAFFFPAPKSGTVPTSIYDFKVASLDGGTIDFASIKGRKILIVNTASKCGYTPQYAQLEALYKQQKDKLVIVGFPANNFLFQEPGSDADIAGFCQKNYGVTFPMASKISVKGKSMAPIYQWLTQKKYNTLKDSDVKWNFQKYLINEQGALVAVFAPGVTPDSDELMAALQQ